MIPISRPTFGPEEEQAVLEVMRSGQLAQGARVRAFECAFASATGARRPWPPRAGRRPCSWP